MHYNKLLLIGLFLFLGLPINAMTVADMRQAIQNDDVDRVREILDKRLKMEPDFRAGKLLQWAKTAQMATVLIDDYGADVNGKFLDDSKYALEFVTPLHTAKTKEVAKVLLAHGAHINARTTMRKAAPLHDACDIGVMEALLERGADPNSQNKDGITRLMYASLSNDQARLLLSCGADPDIKSSTLNINAMQLAQNRENYEIVTLFERQQKLLSLLRANKAPNTITLLRNRELYGTFHSPH